jgi:hypothetical protein
VDAADSRFQTIAHRRSNERPSGDPDEDPRRADFSPSARRFGIIAAIFVCVLNVAYAVVLMLGLRSLRSPDDPIADPYFAAMEVLILLIAPAFVAMMAAVHAYAPRDLKVFSLAALVFTGVLAGITSGVHIVVLTVGRQVSAAELPALPVLFGFRWPSVIYALDILAWDLFYPLAVLLAAPLFRGDGLARVVRVALVASGALGLAGLLAVAVGDMGIRIIGIIGYAGLLPAIALLIVLVFARTPPDSPR